MVIPPYTSTFAINNRVMALDYHQKFVSAGYLENEFMELNQILHMHWCQPALDLDSYMSIFTIYNTVMALG